MKQEFIVREAVTEDKNLVLRFCQDTFEWGDYIERVWDFWLSDLSGKIFVAVLDGVPVGMAHVTMVKAHEAWLEGARVAHELRRQGVSSRLNEACLKWAAGRGARVARLVTDSANVVAQRACEKMSFVRVSEWASMELDGCALEASSGARFAEKSGVDGIWRFLKGSKGFRKSAGLFTVLFRWMSLDRTMLNRFVKRRRAIVFEDEGSVEGLVLFDDTVKVAWHENSVQTCFADGSTDAILSIGRFLKSYLYESGVAKCYGFVCNDTSFVEAFSQLGYRVNNVEFVYEKKLG